MTDITYTGKVTDAAGVTATVPIVLTATAPASGAWPDATNTGVPLGAVLTNRSGFTVTTPGAVIQNLNVTGTIVVKAANVLIKNCRINANGNFWGVDADGFNANVMDCEIFNSYKSNAGILGQGGTYTRVHVHGFEHGIMTEGGCLLQDCYIHDLAGADILHTDGVNIQAGSNTTVRHCHIESFDTSCIIIKDDFTAISNILVDNNRLINTPGKQTAYCVYSDARGGHGGISGVQFTNNIMQRGYAGYASIENNTVVWTNNRDYITGALIPNP
jgi:hypothetical protein